MRKSHSENFLLNKIFKLKFEVGHFKTRTSFIGCSLLIRFSPTKIPIVLGRYAVQKNFSKPSNLCIGTPFFSYCTHGGFQVFKRSKV